MTKVLWVILFLLIGCCLGMAIDRVKFVVLDVAAVSEGTVIAVMPKTRSVYFVGSGQKFDCNGENGTCRVTRVQGNYL